MENNILGFKKRLVTTRSNEEYNSKLTSADYFQRKETFSFHLCTSWNCPGALTYGNRYSQLIDLDEEDIKYFEDKYLSKLDKEMEDKINKIKKEYGKVD